MNKFSLFFPFLIEEPPFNPRARWNFLEELLFCLDLLRGEELDIEPFGEGVESLVVTDPDEVAAVGVIGIIFKAHVDDVVDNENEENPGGDPLPCVGPIFCIV